MRNDVKPFIRSYFNTLPTLLNTEVLTIEEHFHRIGAWNKTHETGYFLSQTRFMLVMEHGDDSVAWRPLVTSNWFKDAMAIDVRNAPTAFGPVSYHITSSTKERDSRGNGNAAYEKRAQGTGNPPMRSEWSDNQKCDGQWRALSGL